jgi:Winged helix DNA-binding domain
MSESTVDQLGHQRVLAERMATQRLTSAPMAKAVDVVRLLTGVQCQDAPLARYSIGLRTGLTDQAVRAELDAGAIVRTHVLRPTWHYVAVEDLRWILALTSAKVESAMAARHRQLELTPAATERAHALLVAELAGRRWLTRPEVGARLAEAGMPSSGEQVGHLLMLAELRALVCSGPLRGTTHTYGLVDEVAPPSPPVDRADGVRELTRRFFVGHGPASENDLSRWAKLTLTEIRSALADLGAEGSLVAGTVGESTLWSGPDGPQPRPGAPRAFLLPVFDEQYLTYPSINFPRAAGHPRGDRPHSFAEAGGGVVVCDRHDVGWWKRKEVAAGRVVVTMAMATSLGAAEQGLIVESAARLGSFTGRTVDIVHS